MVLHFCFFLHGFWHDPLLKFWHAFLLFLFGCFFLLNDTTIIREREDESESWKEGKRKGNHTPTPTTLPCLHTHTSDHFYKIRCKRMMKNKEARNAHDTTSKQYPH
jgi:hypothetical protein